MEEYQPETAEGRKSLLKQMAAKGKKCSVSSKCDEGSKCLYFRYRDKLSAYCVKDSDYLRKFAVFGDKYAEYSDHKDVIGTPEALEMLYKELSAKNLPEMHPEVPGKPKRKSMKKKSKSKAKEGEVIEEKRSDDIENMLNKLTKEDENGGEISEVQAEILKCLGI